jgi:hypothetical protein
MRVEEKRMKNVEEKKSIIFSFVFTTKKRFGSTQESETF